MRAFVVLLAVMALFGTATITVCSKHEPVQSGTAPLTSTQAADVIAGVVVDVHHTGMGGIQVELRCDGHAPATTTTDRDGRFTFRNVPKTICEVRAAAEGLAPAATRVAVGDLPRPPLTLSLGVSLRADQWDAQMRKVAPSSSPLVASRPEAAQESAAAGVANGAVGGVPGEVSGGVAGGIPSAPEASAKLMGGARQCCPMPYPIAPGGDFNTAAYDHIDDNRFRRASDEPLSTFSIDVDTASYSNVRRFLNEGTLPPADAVRIEELINYFRFGYEVPSGADPLSIATDIAACPWNPQHRLALVGVQARRDNPERIGGRNLVFLLDVSGSMTPPERLPLVKAAMRMLVDTLTSRDRVAIVVYAGASGLVLPSTPGDRRADILQSLERLQAGGSTNGAAGIQLAYDTAAAGFVKGGVNRVILATDGDFNVGVTSQGELVRLIEQERERGIFLSVLGVGNDNLKDSTMEKLADRGNGNYAYLDSLDEARRVLVAEASSTLLTVAKDVKIQIEFNPRRVGAYRLIGYENRVLNREDFNDDRKDAGEVGAGHTITALYELVPPGAPIPGGSSVDPLKYQEQPRSTAASGADELMTVKLRYKDPDGSRSKLVSRAVRDRSGEPGPALGFASAVAQFGMLLRDSEFKGSSSWSSVRQLARRYRGEDLDGYRGEFIRLTDLAAALQTRTTPIETTAQDR
jgi:Ca-activated chloride channel family protein